MGNLKQIKNSNFKYYTSEVVGVVFGLASTALAAYGMDKVSNSNSIISVTSAVGGTVGATIGSVMAYVGLHVGEYKNRHRNFRQDVNSLIKSRLEGTGTIYAVRLPLQYVLQKFCNIDPVVAAPVSQIIAGVSGVGVRVFRNYQRRIFGNHELRGRSELEKFVE